MQFESADFALCLTHDVDRPYKTYQSFFFALTERPLYHLGTLRPGIEPYWQFEDIMALEADLGVRSAFYILNEPSLFATQPPNEWVRIENLIEHAGRYDVTDGDLVRILRSLDDGGWEVGVHGSFHTDTNPDRLGVEKRVLESILGHEVYGGRQHHLKLGPETWRAQRELGFRYDASLGSRSSAGFLHGYDPLFPFDDDFALFPLTAMEVALPDPGTDFEAAQSACETLVDEAAANNAVMTVLWHPRYFNEKEFPGYKRLYRHLVQYALDCNGWVGPPLDCYEQFVLEDESVVGSG
ncbi:polysaccharide deacetylase family protein (plasmid) [Haloferax sp. S1W]|uniref:polysaccharide deacetylase family protein n=1 Tax=Haloferax sp. S1W TaxID=3377110 RepID=UPI0037C7665A